MTRTLLLATVVLCSLLSSGTHVAAAEPKIGQHGSSVPAQGGPTYSQGGYSQNGYYSGGYYQGNYGLPQGRRYYNGRYFGNLNNRYYGPQYGYF